MKKIMRMFHLPSDPDSWRWLLVPVVIFSRYAWGAALLFGIFYTWKRRDWFFRKIQQRFPTDNDYRREVGYSILTALIFAAMVWLCLGTPVRAFTRFYTDVDQYGVWYLVGSIPLTVLLHDAYFYWMHRLMHHPRIYRYVHRVHHRSVNPSPWAAYAFHPSEAVLEAGILPILLFLLPLHPIALFAFITTMLWFNLYGHLGYELFPKWMYAHPLGRWLNAAIYHNQHHERFDGNYGLYFTFWDRWMGTLRNDSKAKTVEVHARIDAGKLERANRQHAASAQRPTTID